MIIYLKSEPPKLRGVLRERIDWDNNKFGYYFDFVVRDKVYSLMILPNKSNRDIAFNNFKEILSGIEPFDDIKECHKIMIEQYKNNELSKYPEVLLLTSLISLTDPNIENMTELRDLLKKKKYSEDFIKTVQEQIDILKSRED